MPKDLKRGDWGEGGAEQQQAVTILVNSIASVSTLP